MPDLTLWVPPVAGVGAAVVIAAVAAYGAFAAYRTTHANSSVWQWLVSDVHAGAAWTAQDSWVTSAAAAGGILGTIDASLQPQLGAAGLNVTLLWVFFGGTAAFAPVVYAAAANTPSDELQGLVGSAWGLLLSGVVALLAAMGEIATVALLVVQTGTSVAERVVVAVLLVIGGVFVGVYSVRSLALEAAPPPAQQGQGAPRKSLLGAVRTSATL